MVKVRPTFLLFLPFLILAIIGIGFAVWRLTNPETIPFQYSIENVQLNESWLNFTICFIELPKNKTMIYSFTLLNTTTDINTEFSVGDRLSPRCSLVEPIQNLENVYCYLHTESGTFKIQIIG